MKIKKIWVVPLVGLLLATQAKSQTVDELVKKSVDAIGGPDKLSKINSLYEETTVSAMGNESPATITILNGKGFKSESEFNGQKIIQCFNDKSGWVINPMAGSSDPIPMPQEQYNSGKDQIDIGGPLFNYAAKGIKVELVGRENVGSVSTYKIKVVNSANIETMLYIDPGTYYIVKVTRTMSFNGQPVDISILYSNFQKTDYGLTVANSIETSFGEQFSMTSTVKKVEVNRPVDAKIFEMPK